MNYLQLINKCLLELNYREVSSFSELIKNDHKRIKNILNVINKEICAIEGWNFLLRRMELTLPAGCYELHNSVNGRILYLLIDGEKYTYSDNIEPFLTGHAKSKTYAQFNDKLLFPKFSDDKVIDIVYYTNNSVIDSNNQEKENFENADDKSIIPAPFSEQLLVYGTCLRLKANPQYIKFSYWVSMYKEALQNLKSKTSLYAKDTPVIRLFRG